VRPDPTALMSTLPPAYPYFGSKAAIADVIWDALGNVPNFVDPACGSAAALLARPHSGKIETINEINGFITNFLRAVQWAPVETAEHASWNVNEIDMHARHASLMERVDNLEERLRADARYFDTEIAGWWVWGQSIWIGAGWCDATKHEGLKRPAIGGRGKRATTGVGIFRSRMPHLIGPHTARKLGQIPSLAGSDGSGVGYGRGIFASGRREDLVGYFEALATRLDPRVVRITCGDWSRVVTPAVTVSHGLTGVLLDPPYGKAAKRTKRLYAHDSMDVASAMREWAIANGDSPLLRIVLCGYEGEHEMPGNWRVHAWKANGGYGNQDGENANASKERLWLSPHCVGQSHEAQIDMFAGLA
jgi:DNA adenine methylase